MSCFARVVIAISIAACSSRTPAERERALERIPAVAQLITAADGPALATSAFRGVIDALRPHVPLTLGCVLDAATTSESVAAGMHPDSGATIVLVTRAVVANCPALSKIADRVWVATIGAGAVATERAASVLADDRWERARPYLLREPFALAAELPAYRVIAVAQPEPLDAWLAIDSLAPAELEAQVRAILGRYVAAAGEPTTGKLVVQRAGTQVSVKADQLGADAIVAIVVDTVRALDRPASVARPSFRCPPAGAGIVSCHDTTVKLASLAGLLTELAVVPSVPVVAGGDIVGIRLLGDPPRLLERDDVILGVESHRIAHGQQLAELAKTMRDRAVLAVRRDGHDLALILTE